MEHAHNACLARFRNHRARIVFSVASVHDHGLACFTRKRELLGECSSLFLSRRIVVVIVEATFPNRDGSVSNQLAQLVDMRARIEPDGIVRMDARSAPDESPILSRDNRRCASGAEDILGAAP